jgi:hypothetical protein
MKVFVPIYLLVILKSVICGISGTKTDFREKGIDFTPFLSRYSNNQQKYWWATKYLSPMQMPQKQKIFNAKKILETNS